MYLCRKHFLKKRAAAVIIQNKFRATILARLTQRHFLVMKGAAISVQAWYKGCMQRAQYRNTLVCVRRLQAIIRGYLVRKQNRELQKAVCFVQIKYREKKLTDQLRAEFLEKKGAAVTIQAWYKGHIQRMKYQHYLTCVCKVQSVVRGHLERKHLQELRRAVRLVQRRYRERKLTDQLRTEFLERKGAVMTIQAWYRGHIQRVKYQHYLTSVCKIQSTIRGYLVRKQLQDLRRAACVVQRRYKEKRLTQSLHRDFLQKRMSAVCIQRAYRVMVQKRKEILAQRRAVFLSKFVSLVQYSLSAFQIQRAYRKYRTLCAAKKKIKSILCIQHWMRAKLVRLRYLRFKRSLTEVQRLCKVHLRRREDSARIIQAYFRRWQTRQQEQRKIHAAVTLQAVWRGRQIRIKSKSRKLANIRQRIEEANRSATEEKKLCNRTASALDYLLKYKHLSQILDALMHLDVATRLSSHCCVRMVEVNAVQVIYTLIQSCNRSQPHMEIINYSVSILLNLAKYDKTVGAVYIPGSVDVLLELLQIYREKGVIFYRTCTLLGILGIDLDRRMTIGSDPKFKDKIQSLHVLVSRKNKVNETRQLRQARQLAAKSFNCTLPVHVPVKKVHKIRPDWVLQRDKMHEIDNPMQAINFVMDNYNITPKK
ncbi:hypothetical protein FSP39_015668 [Pinctada imbricata]|uniref:Abnormal spindle-like microcephaly-associated protein n=1 Tax=Pinctada imbricata TaxID=66713 RepID=A0AA88XLQ2_PINIB|nr:hypothetical protein FSP39_015668 [Pinctada imbricata]